MTAQEAYAELISIRKNREDGYLTHLSCGGKADEQEEYTIEAYSVALNALEKQIPKQPKYEDVDNVYGAIKRTCTACGDVCMVSKGAKPYEHYCRQCGQALEWSENNG